MIKDKKLLSGILSGILIFLFYLLLYFSPIAFSMKLSFGFSFPVILLSLFILMKINFLSIINKILSFILLVIITSLIFFPVLPHLYTIRVGNREIHDTVNSFESEFQTPKKKLNKIMKWEKKNLDSLYKEIPITFGPPVIWHRSKDPSWIFFYKIANCEEQAILFTEMAEALENVERARVVNNPAEDHNWAEVLIENSWRQVDPTRVDFINPSNYEEERNVQVSFVYVFENGKITNVTKQYSDVGILVVKVTENGSPVENSEVIVKSKFLMNNSDGYDKPRSIVLNEKKTFLTDNGGICRFMLGGNEYKIVVKKNGEENEEYVTLKENRTIRVGLEL